MTDKIIDDLDKLNLVKSLICSYLIVFVLLLRASHLILLPVVAIVGSPFFLLHRCICLCQESKAPNDQEDDSDQYNQESAKKQLNPDVFTVNSARQRPNQVADEEVVSARNIVAL